MNVEKVRQQISNPVRLQKKQHKAPDFTGKIPNVGTTANINMEDEVRLLMPPAVKAMKKVCDNMGEVQNIIINALGTGLVAPIFIKWNPLSKTDEDTRTYSAWRQPVSAVLAIVTQVGITIPFNRMIERRANNGFYDEQYNKTLFQDKDFIEKQLKRLYPYATKDELARLTKAKMNEQKANLRRMIKENNIVMSTNTGKAHKYSESAFTNLLNKVLDDKLGFENKELKKCEEITIPKKISRCEYYRANHDEALRIFTDIDNKLNKENPKNVKKYVQNLRKKVDAKSELASIYDDILDRRGNKEGDLKIAMKDKLQGILRDIDNYTKDKYPTAESLSEYIKQMETDIRINPIKESIEALEQMKQQVSQKQTVASIETGLDSIVRKNTKHRLFEFKFSDEVAKALEKQIKNNLKGHKQIMGLIVSFLTLPVSCTMLNWCYPRFMDAVFPNLSNKKHPQEVKDLVDKANKQTEVK